MDKPSTRNWCPIPTDPCPHLPAPAQVTDGRYTTQLPMPPQTWPCRPALTLIHQTIWVVSDYCWLPALRSVISFVTDSSDFKMEVGALHFVPVQLLFAALSAWLGDILRGNVGAACALYVLAVHRNLRFVVGIWRAYLSLQINSHMTYPSSRDCIIFVLFAGALVMFLCMPLRRVAFFHIDMKLLLQISGV